MRRCKKKCFKKCFKMFDFGEEFFKMITVYWQPQGNILVNFSPNAQTCS